MQLKRLFMYMSMDPSKRKELQSQFREMFERMESWEAMSAQIGVSTRTLMMWGKQMSLKRKRFKRTSDNYTADGSRKRCGWDNCNRDAFCRGYCPSHYNTARKKSMITRESGRTGSAPVRISYASHCDHKGSYCECINPGKSYADLIRHS